MDSISFFLKNGWQILWKDKLVWIFGVLYVSPGLTLFIPQSGPLGLWLSFAVPLGALFATLVGEGGIVYVAYHAGIGDPTSLSQTWLAVRKCIGRILGVDGLFLLAFSPLCLIFPLVYNHSARTLDFSSGLWLLPGALGAILLPVISLAHTGIVVENLGVRKSIANAWRIVVSHFGTLVFISLFFAVGFWILDTLMALFFFLAPSNFTLAALSGFNVVNHFSMANMPLYRVLNILAQWVYVSYLISVYVSVYLKGQGKV